MKSLLKIFVLGVVVAVLGCGKKSADDTKNVPNITPTNVEYNAYKVVHHISEVIKHIKKHGLNSFDFPSIAADNEIGLAQDLDNFHSKAIADLREGPVVVTTPAAGKRYSSIQVVDQEHFTVFTKVLTSGESFVLVKEDYSGELPKGTVVKTKSNFPYIFIRTQSFSQDEDREGDALRRKVTITASTGKITPPALNNPQAIITWSNANSLPYAETRSLLTKAESSYSAKIHKGTIAYLQRYITSGAVFDNHGMYEAIDHQNGGDDKTRAAGVLLGHLGMPAEEIYMQKITVDPFGSPLTGDSGPVVILVPSASVAGHFWSLTCYDAATNLPLNKEVQLFNSYNCEPDFNGNVRIEFSMENNKDGSCWIPVDAGQYYFIIRYYGPEKALNNRTVLDLYFDDPALKEKHKPQRF